MFLADEEDSPRTCQPFSLFLSITARSFRRRGAGGDARDRKGPLQQPWLGWYKATGFR